MLSTSSTKAPTASPWCIQHAANLIRILRGYRETLMDEYHLYATFCYFRDPLCTCPGLWVQG